MKIYVLSLFPQMIEQSLSHSILLRAQKEGHITIEAINIRDFAQNKHNSVDDYPYGGGAGMVMAAPPVFRAYEYAMSRAGRARTIITSPQGRPYNQEMAEELSREESLIIICGHYEGIDERVPELTGAEEVSIGDYVLTGGEIAAVAIIDSAARLIDGVLGSRESYMDESFSEGLLEYPQYTRPAEFMNIKVPQVLLSGNHKEIEKWRREQALLRTENKRKDLLSQTKYDKML